MTPTFGVISGKQVREVITGREAEIIRVVEAAYRLHGAGRTVNPDSYFLRFADRPSARIIALPASVGGDVDVHGIKWIASFPDNVAAGLARASAVLILNDTETGYPFACLESSIISASRTAASAALAASALSARRGAAVASAGFVGAGPIARTVYTFLRANGFTFDEVGVYDLAADRAERFANPLRETVTVHDEIEPLIRSAELVVFATTAATPHVTDPAWFDHHPVVLHLSLRDLAPEIVVSCWNVTDDTEHCMKAGTSLHLTERLLGHRQFVAAELYDVLTGRITCPADRPVVFSPFGLGVLDLAVGRYVHDRVAEAGGIHDVPDFFVADRV